ncbi:MAG: GMC family oxidoreductase N-terminal domain-containing protein, partial [Proteobacteria bacterium]|nr:GMC family oxidoreductase N-terminal domain-containing protein [Pseudomonadota bacterium]
FKRLERDLDYGDADYHGDAGPISIRRYPPADLLVQHQAFLEASTKLGYPACDDANDPDGWGAGPQPMNKLGRLRVSCAIGYLAPARVRPNLTIRADTLVTRLVVEGGKCTGVVVETADGSIETVAGTTTVLCAGALLSPGILMRSGLGPSGALDGLGLQVLHAVPGVGANLSDHPALSVNCAVRNPDIIDFDAPMIQTILRYTAPGSEYRNDLQIEQLSFSGRPGRPASFAIAAVLEYQHGRGELRLTSADPHAAPVIDNRFCEDPRDSDRLVACYRDTLAFTRAEPLAGMIDEITFPRDVDSMSDADLAALCRRFAGSGYHPCGTLKMGPASDAQAVVDSFGCSHHLDNLAVADASIMPWVPRANTNLTAIMIGEKIGEWIRTRPGIYGL